MAKQANEPRSLFFDPDDHPDNTHKAFNEFTQIFELRYNAQYPDPSRVSLDAAIERLNFSLLQSSNQIQNNNMTEFGLSGDPRIE